MMRVNLGRLAKRAALVIAALLILGQAVRPARTNPPVDPARTLQATGRLPADVGAIFARACNDCHSSLTRWPWYSEVSPVSWWLVGHVTDARRELSLSTWGDYDERRMGKKLQEICDEVREGKMPLPLYLPLHPNARLTDDDRKAICRWTEGERARLSVAGESGTGREESDRAGSEREDSERRAVERDSGR